MKKREERRKKGPLLSLLCSLGRWLIVCIRCQQQALLHTASRLPDNDNNNGKRRRRGVVGADYYCEADEKNRVKEERWCNRSYLILDLVRRKEVSLLETKNTKTFLGFGVLETFWRHVTATAFFNGARRKTDKEWNGPSADHWLPNRLERKKKHIFFFFQTRQVDWWWTNASHAKGSFSSVQESS